MFYAKREPNLSWDMESIKIHTLMVAAVKTVPEMSSKAGLLAKTRLSMDNPLKRLSPNLWIGLLDRYRYSNASMPLKVSSVIT